MDTVEVLQGLLESATAEQKKALQQALRAIEDNKRLKEQYRYCVGVPCRRGDKVYSIIGEKVHSYVVDGFRLEEDGNYMISGDVFLPEKNIGKYYFFSEELANKEHKKWREGVKGNATGR